ncbi:NAD(P)-dependent oxidoreductase [Pelagibacterales bacterium SAG-MED45]|nr:NAD(P)-dependent oxidoreductase [Pelagibacterales bacterium SAG-MED45]|tara:strand:- start:944 stop:1951 length:1008 start_codon:yes stop_codon:yes gene_type:complete
MKKKILIIGGSGFIGHNLSIFLKKKNFHVNVIDNYKVNNLKSIKSEHKDISKIKIYKNFLNERLKLLKKNKINILKVDAKNLDKLKKIFLEIKPHIVIHLAAVSHADRSNKDPNRTFENSVLTLQNSLESSRIINPHFIFFSSSMVYGDFKKKSVKESAVCNPKGIYGTLKYCSELMIKSYSDVFGLKYTIVRPSALYGERCISSRVGQIFLEKSIKKEVITINGDGTDKLDFTYINDLMYGVYKIIITKKSLNQIFNITYGHSRKISEMLNLVKKNFKNVKVNYIKRDKLVPKRGTLSIAKAKKLLGYKSNFPLEKGFLRYIKWYKTKKKIFDI